MFSKQWFIVTKERSLVETNPYLRDLYLRDLLIKRSAMTSSAIEGFHHKDLKKVQKAIDKYLRTC